MIAALADLRDRFFGRGRHAATLPPMDGVLRPNSDLERAPSLIDCPAPHHLHSDGTALWFNTGATICRQDAAELATVAEYGAPVTAFARGADGALAVATEAGELVLPMALGPLPDDLDRRCITGLSFGSDGACLLTVGSTTNGAAHWQKDLLEGDATGSLWRIAPDGAVRRLAAGLAWPEAPLPLPDGSVLVSECSRYRLLRVAPGGKATVVLPNLPGYPAGICAVPEGYALCLKAPRSQLIEFVLHERAFATEMVRRVEAAHWIAPSLHPPSSFLEPLQGGALKQLGIMKPWAPSRSSGLVIVLDRDFVPLRSHHSRADGRSHGTVSCAPWQGGLAVASQGAGRILNLTPDGGERA